jgi:hypothetical protein
VFIRHAEKPSRQRWQEFSQIPQMPLAGDGDRPIT